MEKIKKHFQTHVWSSKDYSPNTSICTIVGKRWLSDDAISMVFDIINREHDDTICFVSKPTRIMYSAHGLNEKVIYSKCKKYFQNNCGLKCGL